MNKIQLKRKTEVVARFKPRDRVKYLGNEFAAYYMQVGVVQDIMSDDRVAVLLDGATNPIVLPTKDLTIAMDPNLADPAALMTSKQPRFRFIANTSGGLLSIPDLRSDSEPEGIAFEAGEKADLLEFFTVEEINRARSLKRLIQDTSPTSGLPYLMVLESLDDPLPEGAVVKPMIDSLKPGDSVAAPENVFDDKLDELIAREEARNEKLKARTLRQRRTKTHGAGSSHLGKG